MKNSYVLRSGFWDVEIDAVSSRVLRLAADGAGLGRFCQEMLSPGLGGECVAETPERLLRSSASRSHRVEIAGQEESDVAVRGVRLADMAEVDLLFSLVGFGNDTLRVEITRRILKPALAVTDLIFGFQCFREFAFWSKPDFRQGHDPASGHLLRTATHEEVRKRRVIGWHACAELKRFLVHGSPSYPDIEMRAPEGCYHLENRYGQHVTFGISSADFSAGPRQLDPGEQSWVVEFRPIPQGKLAPVAFRSESERTNRFIPGFFDGHLLSGIACDHEYFGNNPYRHCYCPGAVHHMTRGFLVTSSASWDVRQGRIEEKWENHIRRTLLEGMAAPNRVAILMDSGVWQQGCGLHSHDSCFLALNACFALACCHVALKSGNRVFASEIYPAVRGILEKVIAADADDDGLLESANPGTPGTASTSYNDALSTGHKCGYLNAAAYEALVLSASLGEWLGYAELSERFRDAAEKIKTAYNRQLWSEDAGRYAGWIDVEGKRHDAWYTFTNFLAVAAGIVPEDRFASLMQSFESHPNHHRIFAAGMNLDPITDGSYITPSRPFGVWLNGGVLLGPAAFELYARALSGAERAWVMLDGLIGQWERDALSVSPVFDYYSSIPPEASQKRQMIKHNPRMERTGGNAYTWIDGDGATGAGTEPYLSDGGALLWALYAGVLGIRTDFQGVFFVPHIPKALSCARVILRMMGRTIKVNYHGYGDALKSIQTPGNLTADENGKFRWTEIPDGADFNIEMEHAK